MTAFGDLFNEKQTDWQRLQPITDDSTSKPKTSEEPNAHLPNVANPITHDRGRSVTEQGNASTTAECVDAVNNDTTKSMGSFNDFIKVNISLGSVEYRDVILPLMFTIGQIKTQIIYRLVGIKHDRQKIICKGTILKNDKQLLRDTKLKNGSKVIVMQN